jgi:4-hydroxymandelate oxidase
MHSDARIATLVHAPDLSAMTDPDASTPPFMNLFELERTAEQRLPPMAWAYYAGGARDEVTLRENRAAYERIALRYRVLRDISERDLSIELLGDRLSMPILVAPTAFHRLACPEGEVATAAAAGSAGTVMILSTISTCAMEDVVRASGGSVWFQLYVFRDRGATEELVRRAEAAGCEALVLTVDAQVWGVRERDVQHRFGLPEGVTLPNLAGPMAKLERPAQGSGLGAYVNALFDPTLSWDDLEWLAGITDLPVFVKGIVHPDDAARAVERGAAGVIVSNHGGRQLDTAPATIRALPEVAAAVDRALAITGRDRSEFPVLVDGGIRRGTDVVKALALGADAVCVGRPILWGLATGGEQGARRVLDMLRAELDGAIALCGARTPAEIRAMGRDLVMGPE